MSYTEALFQATANLGGTWNSSDWTSPTEGWAVGRVEGTFATIDPDAKGSFTAFDTALRSAAGHGPFVGVWLDGGLLHVDPVDVVADVGEARALGAARGQRAVYNIGTGETVRL